MSNVTHPQHYNATKFEVWDVLDAWFPTNPTLWNVGKYLARADRKGGVEDLKKAKVYLEREIEKREAHANDITITADAVLCVKCAMPMPRTEGGSIYCPRCEPCPTSPHMITR